MATRRRERGTRRGPVKLTPQVIAVLEQAIAAGIPMQVSAAGASVSVASFEKWMSAGRKEHESREEGLPANPAVESQLTLFRAVLKARADAAARNVLLVQRAAQGGAIIEETIETSPDGTERKTVRRAPPDWRASAWYLERQYRPQFGREAVQVELTGGDGSAAPVSAGAGVDVNELAAKISTNLAAIEAPPAVGDDDIVDAEIVEEQAVL